MTANFTSLTWELVKRITQSLNLKDFCSLRLSCSGMYSKSKDEFCNRFYSKKTINEFLCSSKSFQSFLALLNTPRLAVYVQHLEITDIPNHAMPMQSAVDDGYEAIVEAFSHLKNLNSLSFHRKGCHLNDSMAHCETMAHMLLLMLRFLMRAKVSIKTLRVGCTPHNILAPLLALDSLPFRGVEILQSRNQTCLTNTSALADALQTDMARAIGDEAEINGAKTVLEAAPCLRDLRLCIGRSYPSRPFSPSQSIITIHEDRAEAAWALMLSNTALYNLLTVRQNVLRCVDLEDIHIHDRWVPLLICMHNFPLLSAMSLRSLSQEATPWPRRVLRFRYSLKLRTFSYYFIAEGLALKRRLDDCIEWLQEDGY